MSDNGKEFAFPHENEFGAVRPGLTKREYFAGLAMQGICAAEKNGHANWREKANSAVIVADYLLAELAK